MYSVGYFDAKMYKQATSVSDGSDCVIQVSLQYINECTAFCWCKLSSFMGWICLCLYVLNCLEAAASHALFVRWAPAITWWQQKERQTFLLTVHQKILVLNFPAFYFRNLSKREKFFWTLIPSCEILKRHYINLCILAPNYAHPSPLILETLVCPFPKFWF